MFNSPFGLDKANGRIMGVCSGIADYTGVEAVWIRLLFVLGTVAFLAFPLAVRVLDAFSTTS